MPSTLRDGLPYIWLSWLAKVLIGDQSCLAEPWLKAHYNLVKVERDGATLAKWKVDHTALLNKIVAQYKLDGWTATVENQNKFTIKGTSATVAGKPDLIVRKGQIVRVIDAKGGMQRDSDIAQVMIAQLLLPMAWSLDVHIEGEVVYKDYPKTSITFEQAFAIRPKLLDLIKTIASGARPEAVPSEAGCRFCDVSKEDCPQRFGEGAAVDVLTSEF